MHATKLLALAALLLAGCPDRTISAVPIDQGTVETKDIPAVPRRGLDILFVIDDSGSMVDEQASLRANFSRLIGVLESIDGGLPDIHIGVVTPNLGTSATDGSQATALTGCSGTGENGTLRALATGGPRFLESFDDGAGGRTTNFPGMTLTDAFAQIANVGTAGCGIEQHLEAMKRATDNSNPLNAGFLRTDAYLAVIVIADEDDCSLAKSTLFDDISRSDPNYGPKTNFRCTSQGVACDTPGTDFESANGVRQDCHPKFDSTELTQIDRYVTHLKSLKPDPRDVMVAGIVGNPEPFEITKPAGITIIKDNCPPGSGPGGSTGVAFPSVRTSDFLDQFLDRNTRSTICDGDLSDGLEKIGELLIQSFDDPCFDRDLLDVDPVTPGPQYECTVTEVRHRAGEADVELRTYPACAAGNANTPCWHVEEDAVKCSFTEANPHLKIVIERGDDPTATATDIHSKVQCVT
ncbi:MAG: hypothetical protein ABI867_34540, partial [Kofleriaceae bacterium]